MTTSDGAWLCCPCIARIGLSDTMAEQDGFQACHCKHCAGFAPCLFVSSAKLSTATQYTAIVPRAGTIPATPTTAGRHEGRPCDTCNQPIRGGHCRCA